MRSKLYWLLFAVLGVLAMPSAAWAVGCSEAGYTCSDEGSIRVCTTSESINITNNTTCNWSNTRRVTSGRLYVQENSTLNLNGNVTVITNTNSSIEDATAIWGNLSSASGTTNSITVNNKGFYAVGSVVTNGTMSISVTGDMFLGYNDSGSSLEANDSTSISVSGDMYVGYNSSENSLVANNSTSISVSGDMYIGSNNSSDTSLVANNSSTITVTGNIEITSGSLETHGSSTVTVAQNIFDQGLISIDSTASYPLILTNGYFSVGLNGTFEWHTRDNSTTIQIRGKDSVNSDCSLCIDRGHFSIEPGVYETRNTTHYLALASDSRILLKSPDANASTTMTVNLETKGKVQFKSYSGTWKGIQANRGAKLELKGYGNATYPQNITMRNIGSSETAITQKGGINNDNQKGTLVVQGVDFNSGTAGVLLEGTDKDTQQYFSESPNISYNKFASVAAPIKVNKMTIRGYWSGSTQNVPLTVNYNDVDTFGTSGVSGILIAETRVYDDIYINNNTIDGSTNTSAWAIRFSDVRHGTDGIIQINDNAIGTTTYVTNGIRVYKYRSITTGGLCSLQIQDLDCAGTDHNGTIIASVTGVFLDHETGSDGVDGCDHSNDYTSVSGLQIKAYSDSSTSKGVVLKNFTSEDTVLATQVTASEIYGFATGISIENSAQLYITQNFFTWAIQTSPWFVQTANRNAFVDIQTIPDSFNVLFGIRLPRLENGLIVYSYSGNAFSEISEGSAYYHVKSCASCLAGKTISWNDFDLSDLLDTGIMRTNSGSGLTAGTNHSWIDWETCGE